MPALKTYDVFISRGRTYTEDYFRVVKFLKDAANSNWRNYTVPEHDPADLKDANSKRKLAQALRRQINPANVVLAPACRFRKASPWGG